MEKALESLKNYQWGDDPNALNPIDEAIVASHGNAAARRDIEDKLLAILAGNASRSSKDYICRKLKIIGTDACVTVLASMLGDDNHSHMARYALQSIPTEAAGKALGDALEKLPGKLKAGVIGSLGARADSAAVAALARLVDDEDPVVSRSAICALGAIRTKDAAAVLAKASVRAEVAGDAMDAKLACAESMLASGDKPSALAIYKQLSGSPAKHIKLAATRGMLACTKN